MAWNSETPVFTGVTGLVVIPAAFCFVIAATSCFVIAAAPCFVIPAVSYFVIAAALCFVIPALCRNLKAGHIIKYRHTNLSTLDSLC